MLTTGCFQRFLKSPAFWVSGSYIFKDSLIENFRYNMIKYLKYDAWIYSRTEHSELWIPVFTAGSVGVRSQVVGVKEKKGAGDGREN